MVFFNGQKLGKPSREFVLWLDCMGTQCFMQREIETAANFIFKFQSAIAMHCSNVSSKVRVYPVMAGAYIACPDLNTILLVATNIMNELAELFISTPNVHHRFLVRGALAYGDVYHGDNVPNTAFTPESKSKNSIPIKKNAVLLGTPVIQAYQREGFAPPFGIALHSSCKLNPHRDSRLNGEWFVWCADKDMSTILSLQQTVEEYFVHYEKQTTYSGYSEEKIKLHRKAFEQYIHLRDNLDALKRTN